MTFVEIQTAVDALSTDQKRQLVEFLQARLAEKPTSPQRHSVLDIPTVDLGEALQPLSSDDDLLGEMLVTES